MKLSQKTFIALLLCLVPFIAEAQRRHPVDTIAGPDTSTRIVLMSDHTWEYLTDGQIIDSDMGNWMDQAQTPFRKSLASIPDTVTLNLVDSMGIFTAPITGTPSSHYGMRWGRRHTGTDVPLHTGDHVLAAFDGIVSRAEVAGGYGNLVVIRHINGLETYYAHLSSIQVVPGEWVTAGQIIGLGGSTGHSTGPHLHFETRYLGFPFDPERLVDFQTGDLKSDYFKLAKSYFGSNSKNGVEDYVGTDALDAELMASTANTGTTTAEKKEVAKQAAKQASKQSAKKDAAKKAAKQAAKKVYYTVKEGDNLTKIAIKYHTTVGQICNLNKIKETKPIRPGQSLRVK